MTRIGEAAAPARPVDAPLLMSTGLQATRRTQPALTEAGPDAAHSCRHSRLEPVSPRVLPSAHSCVCSFPSRPLHSADGMPGPAGGRGVCKQGGPPALLLELSVQVRDGSGGCPPAGFVRCHLCRVSPGSLECSGGGCVPREGQGMWEQPWTQATQVPTWPGSYELGGSG